MALHTACPLGGPICARNFLFSVVFSPWSYACQLCHGCPDTPGRDDDELIVSRLVRAFYGVGAGGAEVRVELEEAADDALGDVFFAFGGLGTADDELYEALAAVTTPRAPAIACASAMAGMSTSRARGGAAFLHNLLCGCSEHCI